MSDYLDGSSGSDDTIVVGFAALTLAGVADNAGAVVVVKLGGQRGHQQFMLFQLHHRTVELCPHERRHQVQ